MSIQPIVKKVERFTVTGFNVRTKNSDEFNEKTAKIPSLWQQFYTSELAVNTINIFGVYSNYDSDANGAYIVTVGIPDRTETKLNSVTIQTGNYLVFQGTGPMPATVVETWKQVWRFFENNPKHRRNFISDFEDYSGPDQVTIYIGLE